MSPCFWSCGGCDIINLSIQANDEGVATAYTRDACRARGALVSEIDGRSLSGARLNYRFFESLYVHTAITSLIELQIKH